MSFRRVPAGIYIGVILGFLGSAVFAVALGLASGEPYERYGAAHRWQLLDAASGTTQSLLVALGLFELARRQLGGARSAARVASWLSLAFVLWYPATLYLQLSPSRETFDVYQWFGRGIGAAAFAGAIALTIAADAWRRVPVAAASLMVVHLTSYWVPGIGPSIYGLFDAIVPQRVYGLVREAVSSGALVVIAAALAARGRDPAADPPVAARSLRLARTALVFRLVTALALAVLMFGLRTPSLAKLVLIGGPLAGVVTMIVFIAAMERSGATGIGLPRLRLAVGLAATAWWTALQIEQLSALAQYMARGGRARELSDTFAIIGPIAATLGMALVASSIGTFATNRGHADLARVVASRTLAFVGLALASVAMQSLLIEARSLDSALLLGLGGAVTAVASLAVFAGMLRAAAEQLEAGSPGLPTARVHDPSGT